MNRIAAPVPPGAGWLLASAAIAAAAHPPFHLLLPSFVALVPLAMWVQGLPAGEEGARAARRGGFLFGFAYFALLLYWLVVALLFYTPLAVLAFLVPVLIIAGFMALAMWGVHEARWRLGWPVWLGLPVFWTATEWLRAHVPQVGFPWMQFGDTLTGFPWLIGAADLVGSRGLSFWLVLGNALLAAALGSFLAGRRTGVGATEAGKERGAGAACAGTPTAARSTGLLAAAWLAVLAVPILYSVVRWHTLEMRPAARVGVVQPNVPQHLKLDRVAATDSSMRSTETLVTTRLDGVDPLDLLVLPETAIHLYFEPVPSIGFAGRPWLERWVADLAGEVDAPVLFGSLGLDDLGDGEYDYFNSAYLARPDGARLVRQDKHYLVPIVERVPFVDPRRFANLEHFGGFGRGDRRPPPLSASETSFGVFICYESIYTQRARHYRHQGADFLVNITNDAWFGREESVLTRTSALWQHPAHMVMRAVETRTGVARSGNTGISGIIDPLGRWTHRTELFVPAAFTGEVLTTDGLTVYVRLGDLVGWGAALAAAGAALFIWRRRRGEG